MDVMRKLTTNGAKASSNPSDMETITDNIMNKALTSNALPTFDDIAFMFITGKIRINMHEASVVTELLCKKAAYWLVI